jgi:hypothetical protein
MADLTVGDNSDDVSAAGASLYTGDVHIDIGANSSPTSCATWAGFTVPYPKYTSFSLVVLRVRAHSALSGTTCKIKIGFEAVDNSTVPATAAALFAKVLSTAYTQDDNVPAWTAGTEYSWIVTAAAQEIINRSGWVANNVMGLLIVDNGSSGNALRRISSYENNATYPRPYLDFYLASGGNGFSAGPCGVF